MALGEGLSSVCFHRVSPPGRSWPQFFSKKDFSLVFQVVSSFKAGIHSPWWSWQFLFFWPFKSKLVKGKPETMGGPAPLAVRVTQHISSAAGQVGQRSLALTEPEGGPGYPWCRRSSGNQGILELSLTTMECPALGRPLLEGPDSRVPTLQSLGPLCPSSDTVL